PVFMPPPPVGTCPVFDTFNLRALNGSFGTPFDESFFFGKLSYEATPTSSLELTLDDRHNGDLREFGRLFLLADHARDFAADLNVDTYTGRAKYSIFPGTLLHELTLGYQRDRAQHHPDAPGTITHVLCHSTAW